MSDSSKVIVVTGSSRGIGAATARLAAARGYAVVVNFHSDAEAADSVVADCVGRGVRAFAQRADVTDEAAVAALLDEAEERLGAVDVLVNNVGIVQPQMRLEEMSVDRWRTIFDVNVIGAFGLLVQHHQ